MFSWSAITTSPTLNQINAAQCCCTIESLVKDNCKELVDHMASTTTTTTNIRYLNYNELGSTQDFNNQRSHKHEHYCSLHGPPTIPDGFVQTERNMIHNLLLLSLTSSIVLGVAYSLVSLDRFYFGPWTFLSLSAAFLFSALSVFYAQACVTRFGPNNVLTLATCSIIFYVLVHLFSNFVLFQLGAIVMALFLGPFYCAQLEFISNFSSRLVHLTPAIKRHQEKRSHRLLHLLLFCPSHIVGHFIFVVLSILFTRMSSETTQHVDNRINQYNLYPSHNHNSLGIGKLLSFRLPLNNFRFLSMSIIIQDI